uniref:Uncharacterized protein n=1 Tax=Rhizophora mucronata TaxID=61149 RepID=A0A2P2PXX1_RHIMU
MHKPESLGAYQTNDPDSCRQRLLGTNPTS